MDDDARPDERTIWERIRDYFIDSATTSALSDYFRGAPEDSVAFTISIIALAAKMAKADGRVTVDEVRTLRQIFEFDEKNETEIARVFDLARQDVAGFESYARKIYRMFKGHPEKLDDIFESLFIIALSDGDFHENEELFLNEIREIFHTRTQFYNCLKNRYNVDSEHDPYRVLGLEPTASSADIKTAYHQIIRENHPDALRAKGLPSEAIALAEQRVRAVNSAYESLRGQ